MTFVKLTAASVMLFALAACEGLKFEPVPENERYVIEFPSI